ATVGFGVVCSLIGALGAGAMPLGGDDEVLIFLLPVMASFLALELMLTATAIVPRVRFLNLLVLSVLGGLTALVYFSGRSIARVLPGAAWASESPALVLLGLAVILLALGGLGLGAGLAFFDREQGETWLTAVRRAPDFRVGVIMLGGFVGAA